MAAPRPSGFAESGGVIRWRFAPFAELTPREVHDFYQVRAAAFVVEQNCVFQDLDGVDPECWHLLGYRGERLIAYARLLPAGVKFVEPSIGRVVTTMPVRGTGLGRELMLEALRRAERLWPGQPIRIGAQSRLERFYFGLGFVTASAPYDEDGIEHIEMLRPASRVPDEVAQTTGQ
jgi:ElaA protein